MNQNKESNYNSCCWCIHVIVFEVKKIIAFYDLSKEIWSFKEIFSCLCTHVQLSNWPFLPFSQKSSLHGRSTLPCHPSWFGWSWVHIHCPCTSACTCSSGSTHRHPWTCHAQSKITFTLNVHRKPVQFLIVHVFSSFFFKWKTEHPHLPFKKKAHIVIAWNTNNHQTNIWDKSCVCAHIIYEKLCSAHKYMHEYRGNRKKWRKGGRKRRKKETEGLTDRLANQQRQTERQAERT